MTSPVRVDGRTERRRRNIDAVVDAVIELAGTGKLDPTSEEIAELAGISHRSIYRYFETRADLLEAAVIRAFETVSSEVFRDEQFDGSFDERVERFVAARVEIYHQLRSIARLAYTPTPRSSDGMEHARVVLRQQLADHFAIEFGELAAEDRRLAIPIVDAAFQFEAIEYLSGNAGLDEESVRTSLVRHMQRHLGPA